ncbi:NAD(P)H:quinone oxidoreductase [Streptomyces mobaraensis NBRC 13819 = DSM 40847]|uniref:Flavodoxin-like protein n=1 Tax=Streptomyces mobaraensis (strain ATCC 29032 / DSM 40847 / JCM 4168 / NBRC 13819 / NCIMB 11159 / IPCR 16-22) TaxID=1223523 RepID=M3C4I2_STRM1|nr:NAD(P)H:quinone oxidoreductase [Streptomyces mobaraensis]EME98865.1 flavodoxin-like protein [Streptomyces mobaraensis NBRC 13819 = DSM 40847]QTT76143.1 NAD(P)H:quinone oxidoreductase [Streptomyces mobaraensis NBRC 13819 = DSM 40847]
MTNVAVVYYSSTGNVHKMAEAAAAEAEKAGAAVRLRRVAELAPQSAIDRNEAWAAHVAATRDVPEATLEDLDWADAVLFGTPTRFGLPAAQLKQFLDTTGGLWFQGKLVNKVVSSFTSSNNTHAGQESTILALNNTFYHWGAVIVPAGFADPVQFERANGNPYGASSVTDNVPGNVHPDNLAAIAYQTRRVVEIAKALGAALPA